MSFELVSFDAFADKHGLVMEIRERPGTLGDGRYYAHFERCEVMDGGCLIGAYGNGATKEAAIADYARTLAGKRIAVDAFGVKQERREIQCPNEWVAS